MSEKKTKYEIQKMLVLSTGHITRHDDILLCGTEHLEEGDVGKSQLEHTSVNNVPYGYQIYVGDDVEMAVEGIIADGLSGALVNLVRRAHKLGCHWLWLDADGLLRDDLPKFEW